MRMRDLFKPDFGLCQALAAGNVTGRYYGMNLGERIKATLMGAALEAGATMDIEFLQATDAGGTGAKGIPTTVGQLAKATITANQKITAGQVVVGAVLAGDVLQIKTYRDGVLVDDITFTCAAATDASKREFKDAAGLETCINDAAKGVPGVTADNAAGTIALTVTEPGELTMDIISPDATLTLSTLEAVAYVEVAAHRLDLAGGFCYVAPKVTTTGAATVIGVLVERAGWRYGIPDNNAAHVILD
jgi:hypothetical protein